MAMSVGQKHLGIYDIFEDRYVHKLRRRGFSSLGIRFSPNGKTLAVDGQGPGTSSWHTHVFFSSRGAFTLFDVETGQPKYTFRGHGDYLTNLCWSPDSRSIWSSATDGRICRWDAEVGIPPKSTEPFVFARAGRRPCSSMDLSPDGTLVPATRTPSQIMLWGLADRSFGMVSTGENALRKVAFTPDGRSLIVAYSTKKELGRCLLKEVNFWQKTEPEC